MSTPTPTDTATTGSRPGRGKAAAGQVPGWVILPRGLTTDRVTARRSGLAADLGPAGLGPWPTHDEGGAPAAGRPDPDGRAA